MPVIGTVLQPIFMGLKNVDSLCTGSTINWKCGLRGSHHWGITSVRDFPRCTIIWIFQTPEQTVCTQPASVSLKFHEHKQSELTSKTYLSFSMLQKNKVLEVRCLVRNLNWRVLVLID